MELSDRLLGRLRHSLRGAARDGNAIASRALGLVKSVVRFPHQGLDTRCPDRGFANADADGQTQRPSRDIQRTAPHQLTEAFGEGFRRFFPRLGKQDCKLFPANPGGNVGIALGRCDCARDCSEGPITNL